MTNMTMIEDVKSEVKSESVKKIIVKKDVAQIEKNLAASAKKRNIAVYKNLHIKMKIDESKYEHCKTQCSLIDVMLLNSATFDEIVTRVADRFYDHDTRSAKARVTRHCKNDYVRRTQKRAVIISTL